MLCLIQLRIPQQNYQLKLVLLGNGSQKAMLRIWSYRYLLTSLPLHLLCRPFFYDVRSCYYITEVDTFLRSEYTSCKVSERETLMHKDWTWKSLHVACNIFMTIQNVYTRVKSLGKSIALKNIVSASLYTSFWTSLWISSPTSGLLKILSVARRYLRGESQI